MSIDAATAAIPGRRSALIESRHHQNVHSSYDGSNVVYRLLRLESWGPALMNLGYYRFSAPFCFLNILTNLELAQRRLVMKAIGLLQIGREDRVLDVACGRGKSSFIASCMHPEAIVVGTDLLSRNVQVAQTLFDQNDNLSYIQGDAMELDVPDASFDRVMCLEAAFHFPDRARFLKEAYRVLRPAGRLIVVDFAWTNVAERSHREDAGTRLVRKIWQWDDIYAILEYGDVAQQSGFRVVSSHDWSHRVTRPIQGLFEFISMMGTAAWSRRLLEIYNPLYRSFSDNDWKEVALAVAAHRHVHNHSKYMAFVFQKPGGE